MARAISIKFAKRVFLVANSRSIAGIISHLEIREFFRVFRAKFGHSDTYLKKKQPSASPASHSEGFQCQFDLVIAPLTRPHSKK